MKNKVIEAIAPQLTALMIRKIESLKTEWQKPWIANTKQGLPRNLRGTYYRGFNTLVLFFHAEIENFKSPIYLTFKQAKESGLNIHKDSRAFPVAFWKQQFYHKENHRRIEQDDYLKLSLEQRKQYKVIPILRYYSVFNLDQTDMAETQPDKYARLIDASADWVQTDGIHHPQIDATLERQSWVCPIHLKYSDRAFYNRSSDHIVCPLRDQFPEGAKFYGTLLHEMAHSTGHQDRLNRPFGTIRGDAEYAREELVAELSAALAGVLFGLVTTPQEDNAAYLKHWLDILHENPEFLFDVLVDTNRAVRMITEQIGIPDESASNGAPAVPTAA